MDPSQPQSPSPSSSSFSDNWKERILIPTILAGVAGGGVGLVSKHRKLHGTANISATYATNLAIVTASYCGAREFVRVNRRSDHDDLLNSVIGGFGAGAILGRLQGGRAGAVKYSVLFAIAGTAMDFTVLKVKPILKNFQETWQGQKDNWLKLPEWSPIQVLDEEALAAKEARERRLYEERVLGKTSEKESMSSGKVDVPLSKRAPGQ